MQQMLKEKKYYQYIVVLTALKISIVFTI